MMEAGGGPDSCRQKKTVADLSRIALLLVFLNLTTIVTLIDASNTRGLHQAAAEAALRGQPPHEEHLQGGGSFSNSRSPFTRYRVQQNFFCNRVYPTFRDYTPSYSVLVNASIAGVERFPMYVYSSDDIVSQSIRMYGSWEASQVVEALRLLEEYRTANSLNKEDVTFLDIGSNVGMFGLTIAMAGYSVIAFEPLQKNEMMLRSSICANNLMDRMTYINMGLGSKRQTCQIMSAMKNSGNGVVVCDNRTIPEGYQVRSTIQVAQLDTLIPLHTAKALRIPVFKIDTEGLEGLVMLGGSRFFSKAEMRFGFLEFNVETQDYTQLLREQLELQGFRIGLQGFRGPEYNFSSGALYSNGVPNRDAYVWRTAPAA